MEDDDVLLENDPLAIYLKNEQIRDFETTKLTFSDKNNDISEIKSEIKIAPSNEDFQSYFEIILKSELLLEEDYNILETYYLNKPIFSSNKYIYKISLYSSLAFISVAVFKYTNSNVLKSIVPFCSLLPITYNTCQFIKRKLKNKMISSLLAELNFLTNSIKKSLRIVAELSATIGYYSATTISNSSINNVHVRFAKEFYSILLGAIKLLAYSSAQLLQIVPLTIDNSIKYDFNKNLFNKPDISNSDLKLLFELYVLVQSDFIKTLGLSFCTHLWAAPDCNIKKLLSETVPFILKTLKTTTRSLENEYAFVRNYGINLKTNIKSPRKFQNSPLQYMSSCLHSSELHFQQLLCKTRDLQKTLDDLESVDNEEQTQIVLCMLNEMEKQMSSSKNMLDAVTKYFNQLQNKNDDTEILPVQKPVIKTEIKSVEAQEQELNKQDKLVYELYIPKEGLALTELEIDSERPVFSIKSMDYSGVLLDELRTILRARNPEVFQEEAANKKTESDSGSDDDEAYYRSKRRDIFRPSQPFGLAENLQTINHVLAARKKLLQNEEFFDDTFTNSDSDEIVNE